MVGMKGAHSILGENTPPHREQDGNSDHAGKIKRISRDPKDYRDRVQKYTSGGRTLEGSRGA